MVSINYALREINCKIVYYGPGLSGKTTNLQFVHEKVPSNSRGDLISLATEADRTLYFDFLPVDVGQIAGFDTKFQLYTVPGQVFYNATRRLVLRGVDGLVFVADSQSSKLNENIESLNNMYDNLRENGLNTEALPLVFQWNKRDLPDILSPAELNEQLNPRMLPAFEAVATTGVGVFDTLKKITKLVLQDARSRATAGTQTPTVQTVDQAGAAKQIAETPSRLPSQDRPGPEPVGVNAAAAADASPSTRPGGDSGPIPLEQQLASVPEPSGTGSPAAASPPAESAPEPPRPGDGQPRVPRPGSTIHREPSLRVRQGGSRRAAGASTTKRQTRQTTQQRKSIFARLFGWLLGR